jgi:putative iron-regulated protein
MNIVLKMLCLIFTVLIGSTGFAATQIEVAQHIAKNVILKDYQNLVADTEKLSQVINQFSIQPTQENLNLAQQSWRDARKYWERSEAFLFGPVDSLGLDPSIDTWPLNIIDLNAVLNSGRTLDIDFVRNLGVNLQGFHTIEFLLFGNGVNTNQKFIENMTAREIQYLVSTAAILSQQTRRLAHAWSKNSNPDDPSTPGFVDIISQPNLNNPFYSSPQAVLIEYVQGMLGILDEVANGKISDPYGSDINAANTDLVESPFSWNSISDFSDNIVSVYMIYTGVFDQSTQAGRGFGLKDIVAAEDSALANAVEQRILQAIQNIQNISGSNGMPFRQAIKNPEARARIQIVIDDLNNLRTLIEEEVLPIIEK